MGAQEGAGSGSLALLLPRKRKLVERQPVLGTELEHLRHGRDVLGVDPGNAVSPGMDRGVRDLEAGTSEGAVEIGQPIEPPVPQSSRKQVGHRHRVFHSMNDYPERSIHVNQWLKE